MKKSGFGTPLAFTRGVQTHPDFVCVLYQVLQVFAVDRWIT